MINQNIYSPLPTNKTPHLPYSTLLLPYSPTLLLSYTSFLYLYINKPITSNLLKTLRIFIKPPQVTADGPHMELKNPHIDHFPDGVFEKCRIAKKRWVLASRASHRYAI